MIVVPSLTERDQRQRQAVSTVVVGIKPPPAKNVCQRIDEKRSMKEHDGADETAPNKKLRPAGAQSRSEFCQKGPTDPKSNTVKNRDNVVSTVEEDQFRITREVGDRLVVRGEIACAREPTNM